ncbi:MAG: hypothetical protein K6F32_01585 [Bacilli bacterium]|nr:hypothetical protein [Bacilli bacterium]
MRRPKQLLFGVLAAASSLGAYYPGSSPSRFYYELYPVMYQRSSSFYFEFYTGTDRPKFTLNLYAYRSATSSTPYQTLTKDYDFTGTNARINATVTIPSSFAKYQTFYLAIKLQGHEYGDERLGAVFVYSDGFDVKAGTTYNGYHPKEGERVDTNRTLVYENQSVGRKQASQSYGFGAFRTELASDAGMRCVDVNRFTLAYKGLSDEDTLDAGIGELRIFTHLDEFPFTPITNSLGQKYLRIPLVFNEMGTSSKFPGFTEYNLSLTRDYWYDKRNLKMSDSTLRPNWYSFKSSNFFVPQGNGHDLEPLSYVLYLWNLSAYRDSFFIEGTIDFANPNFADCGTGNHCVVYGGPVYA